MAASLSPGQAPILPVAALEQLGYKIVVCPIESLLVCARAMRGLYASLLVEEGLSSALVARALGHESPTMTMTAYATRDAAGTAQQRAALAVLDGGKAAGRRKRPGAPAAP